MFEKFGGSGQLERIDENDLARSVFDSRSKQRGMQSRPWLGWMDGVKVALVKMPKVESHGAYVDD